MKRQFLDYIYPLEYFKKHAVSLAMEIGLKLSSGMDLSTTLKTVALEAGDKREEKSLISASERIKKGESPSEVFKDKAIRLYARHRYVLALPIDDLQKGNILKGWLINKKRRERHALSYKTIGASFEILAFVIIALMVFVLPMFHEIVYGMNINSDSAVLRGLENSLLFLHRSKLFLLAPVVFGGLVGIAVFFGKFIFSSDRADEEADIISMIAASDYEHQWQNLEMVSNKICFPKSYKKLKKLVDSLNNGIEPEECIANAQLSPMLTWFLQLSIHNREDRSFLEEGSEFMKQHADYMNNQMVRYYEILLTIVESLILFVFLYYIFGMMELIKTGILS